MSATTTPPAEPVLLKVEAAVHALSLSRSVIYELIRSGRLRTVNEGRARRITRSAINEYVALLEREAGESK
ncbi:helix-turn-helix domain-containing protein [Streptomyces virginiae]|uniref:helix-turn-helix domain-containing protein n=1 Tax=Streptomyces TaxID=1883 RepID=UPI0004CB10D5|nr:helix-turn-helix domain-containing protein [Streptomyces sp. NRRL F-2580]